MQNREIKGKSPPVRGILTGGLLVFLQKRKEIMRRSCRFRCSVSASWSLAGPIPSKISASERRVVDAKKGRWRQQRGVWRNFSFKI